jgi:uncharacterized protein YciW
MNPPLRLSDDDVVAQLAGIAPHGTTAELRAARGDASRFTQGSFDALFAPDATALSLDERLAAAAYAAHLARAHDAADFYRQSIEAGDVRHVLDSFIADDSAPAGTEARLTAILAHTRALSVLDASTDQAALGKLEHVGLSTPAIVALSQLVAFVSYQVRVVAALRALEASA